MGPTGLRAGRAPMQVELLASRRAVCVAAIAAAGFAEAGFAAAAAVEPSSGSHPAAIQPQSSRLPAERDADMQAAVFETAHAPARS